MVQSDLRSIGEGVKQLLRPRSKDVLLVTEEYPSILIFPGGAAFAVTYLTMTLPNGHQEWLWSSSA